MARSKRADDKEQGGRFRNGVRLFLSADTLRQRMAPSDDQHAVFGLIFQQPISDSFALRRVQRPIALDRGAFNIDTNRCREMAVFARGAA